MSLLQDLRYACRSLAKTPVWTFAAVLTLALGVAANTTVFSWLRSVVLEPIPGASDSSSLRVLFGRSSSGEPARLSYPDYRDLARERCLDGLLAQEWVNIVLGTSRGSPPQSLSGALVSGNYFDVLGAPLALGRSFHADETAGAGSAPAAVISHSLWRRSFGGDPRIIGKALRLNGQPVPVVGVARDGFFGSFLGIGVDVWMPLAAARRFDPAGDRLDRRGDRWLLCLARLAPGVSTEQARAALAAAASRLNREYPGMHDGAGVGLVPLSRSPWGGPSEFGPILLTLAALVNLVLLIACANVANLLVNRSLGRRREIAVRLALGASRWQIVRQLLSEQIVLGSAAALAATAATIWTSGLLLSFIPPAGFPVRMDLGVDGRTAALALGISLAGTLTFGLLPALRASRGGLAADLASAGSRLGGSSSRARGRSALAVAQMTLSLVLLVAAALFLRSLAVAQRLDAGFDVTRLLLVQVKLFPAGYDFRRGAVLLPRIEEGAREIPGVLGAALARQVPLGFGGFPSIEFAAPGYFPGRGEEMRVRYNVVSAGYFRTMRIDLRRGREFDRSDRAGGEPVAVVSETFARRYVPGREALGARIQVSGMWRRIVGVTADGKYEKVTEPSLPFLFLPLAQSAESDVVLHLRTSGDPAAALPAVRELLRKLDPNLPIFEVQTMEQHLDEELIAQRIASQLLGALGSLALLLSAVGLYATGANEVAERRREIGLRMALGATPCQLLGAFLRGGLRLAAVGAALGVLSGLAVARLLASQLPGIEPFDPLAFAGALTFALGMSLAATYFPARRAARIDPVLALRGQ